MTAQGGVPAGGAAAGLRLTVVGCTGSVPGPASPASCYLVEADDADGRTWRVLLDLGSGALGALQGLVDPRRVDAVLLSHLHPDHCLDLCGLYVVERYAPGVAREGRLRVVGPTDVAERIAAAYGSEPDGILTAFAFEEWSAGAPVRVGPLTVTPFPAEHPVESYCLRVEAGGRALTYSGDTDSCPGLVEALRGTDLALLDAAFVDGRDDVRGIHLTPSRGARACLDAGGVGRIVLTHLPPWNDPAVVRAQAADVWSGPLDVAQPLATYDV